MVKKKEKSSVKRGPKFKFTDEAVVQSLAGHTQESSRPSLITEKPMKTLTSSVMAMVQHDKVLAGMYSYRHWCRRLCRAKLGISRPKAETDLCEYCATWDGDRQKLHSIIDEATSRAEAIHRDFWKKWDSHVEKKEEWQSELFNKVASPSYLKEMAKYMEEFNDFDGLADQEVERLQCLCKHFATKMMEDGGWYQWVEAVSNHWRIDMIQDASFQKAETSPEDGELVLLGDYQEPHE